MTVHYDRLISATLYEEPIRTLIHLFKYHHYDYLASLLGSFMVKHFHSIGINFKEYNLIIPVPIQSPRLREREYNQTKLLASYISNSLHIPLRDDIIYCKNHRVSQTTLKKDKRKENVKGIFSVRDNLENKNIILIDDIVTTKATVTECSRVMKENGAGKILVLTLAKTQ